MAGLPPRSRSRSSSSSITNRSPLETLQHMGFSKQRAEKAIAATGNRGIQLAAEWLLSHVNDPLLDSPESREYILYLCPTGELHKHLMEFWDRSSQVCGWNSAHIYFPHITLCPFFKIPDNKVDSIDLVMHIINQEIGVWPSVGPLALDLFTQNRSFIGYFVRSPHNQYVEQLMKKVTDEFLKQGVEVMTQTKQIHMTLAFQYDPSHHDVLMSLAKEISHESSASWEIRVYSRTSDLKTAEVRKVIKNYQGVQEDELTLMENDFIYMEAEEHERSPDGWFKGTSHQTGVSALFPGNLTVRCSQMEMWMLHRSVQVPSLTFIQTSAQNRKKPPEPKVSQLAGSTDEAYENVWSSQSNDASGLYSKINKRRHSKRAVPRKLFIIRHAERCDFAFYRTWFDKSFDGEGRYTRFNLNCPKTLVPRSSYKDFNKDCPLTVIGREQARITGEALREACESVSYVYCSPALRCVETATEVIKAYGFKCGMFIEPSLLEWCGWYKPLLPHFMPPEELLKCEFPVDTAYNSYVKLDKININETVDDYYMRSYNFTQHVLQKHKSAGGNILLVGHSGTLDACTRQLTGKTMRNQEEFRNIIRSCPYCGICTALEDVHSGKWALVEPPIPQLTHGANSKDYSWETMRN